MSSSPTTAEHRAAAPRRVRCAVVTVSDTRTEATDTGGRLLVELLAAAGHETVARQIVPDEPDRLRQIIRELAARDDLHAILLTGGTGITARDQTYETVSGLLDKAMPGYGEIFRMLSFEEIGPAAMLSRAVGGVVGGKVLLTMPGSPAAVRLAVERLIGPELGHLVHEATK
jgi:molybdenum cofactor biosynthesis protein B